MNRVFTSIIMALGLINTAMAQSSSTIGQSQDPNEVIVLSSFVDGNYNVEQFLVMESSPSNNEFVVRYKINLTKLISNYDNNSNEIAGLHNFIEQIQNDSLKRITHFDIIGYASPDGPAALNKKLASERANDFCRFIDMECDMADYPRTVTSMPYTWIDTKTAIEKSNVPNKANVIDIIESNKQQSEIQAELENHTTAWDYIKMNILPPMRSVELHIKYNSWKVVENRTLIEEVIPVPVVEESRSEGDRCNRGDRNMDKCSSSDDYINCILIDMPGNSIDFDCGKGDKEYAKFKASKRGAKLKEKGRGEREKIKERKKRWWKLR